MSPCQTTVHILPPHFANIHLILFSHPCLRLPSGPLPFTVFRPKIVLIPYMRRTCKMPRPPHPPLFNILTEAAEELEVPHRVVFFSPVTRNPS